MKKIYEKPTLLMQSFAVDSIMNGTGEEIVAEYTQSNLNPLVNMTELPDGGVINLGDNNTLQSINYRSFTLE